jgi:hypothetical protein
MEASITGRVLHSAVQSAKLTLYAGIARIGNTAPDLWKFTPQVDCFNSLCFIRNICLSYIIKTIINFAEYAAW